MFEFLKLKIERKGNILIIKKGFGFVKSAEVMTDEDVGKQIKECRRAGVPTRAVAGAVWNLPDGVTELKTNIRLLRFFRNGYRPALSLWYVAKYDGGLYYEITDRLKAVGCTR